MTINIVCVRNGPVYSAEYVEILADMVLRNLNKTHNLKFFCFSNDDVKFSEHIHKMPIPENLTGWFAKLYLFKDGLFPKGDRIVYIDITTVITSGLDEIIKYNGEFATLRDFYIPSRWQPAFMMWEADTMGYVWDKYAEAGYPSENSDDMKWINEVVPKVDILQDLFPRSFVSFKADCRAGIPKGAKVVKFHGSPRPHDMRDGWVPKIWKIGGSSSLELEIECNTKIDKLKENISYSLGEGLPILAHAYPEHQRHAVIVGGGPSINGFVDEIKWREDQGQEIVALNNSWKWLDKRGIRADYHVMLDARSENVEFVPSGPVLRLYATQCDHRVINAATG
mgnify:FL=1